MRTPKTVKSLETLGRVRLSESFFMRDFLYSEISQIEGVPNIPDYPDLAIEAGSQLCQQVLEPIQQALGRISIRSGYRSPAVNAIGWPIKISITAPATKLPMPAISGIIWMSGVCREQPLASWLTHFWITTRLPEIGRRWPGGFMTIFRTTARSASFRSCVRSTSAGALSLRKSSEAILRLGGYLPDRV